MSIIIPSKLKDKDHSYLVGDCHHFAIALNRLTGAPLVSFHKDYIVREDMRDGDEPEDMYWSEHAHAAVLVGSGMVVDCKGIRKIEDGDLIFTGTDLSDLPSSELKMTLFDDREEDLASNYADYDENLIQKAMVDVQAWGCDALVRKAMNVQKNKEKGGNFDPIC